MNGFFESLAILDKYEVLRIVDKFDKIGEQAVTEELINLGIEIEIAQRVLQFIKIKGKKTEVIEKLKKLQVVNEMFL